MEDDERTATGLSEEQLATAIAWLEKHLEGATCPVCRHDEFTLANIVTLPVYDTARRVARGSGAVPVVLVVCTRCGYVLHFAAMPMGLFSEPPQPVSPE